MNRDLILVCTDEDGVQSWYEPLSGKHGNGFSRCIKIPPVEKPEGADPEAVKAMPEDIGE